ncbi:hypothetical protein THAOC_02608 [Thalassiosira oceanica]|uniref:Uncharacterized protein n=1 Tax=Thalassiosira oceanica TaxID=159749 RepID=K0TAD9_THAOC|nr:hypothetical protein THAOC_02608 [Thalassiosira oceanica]|eukprot:EJK75663.1 hypothetical protein THAOC_02608 [Thalassiosira oceanica]
MASQNQPGAVPSARSSSVKKEYDCDTDEDNDNNDMMPNLRPPPVASDVTALVKKEYDYDTEDDATDAGEVKEEDLNQPEAVPPARSSPVKKEYDCDTDEDNDNNDLMPPVAPDATALVKKEYDYDTEDDATPDAGADADHPKIEVAVDENESAPATGDENNEYADEENPRKKQKKSQPRFQRQDGLMVRARASDSPTAESYLAYLDDVDEGASDDGCLWIRHISNLTDDTDIDVTGGESDYGDFNLMLHWDYGDCTPFGSFPPLIEEIMWAEATEGYALANEEKRREVWKKHGWIRDFGESNGGWYVDTINIGMKEKEAIFENMRKNDRAAVHCPELSDIFPNMFQF